MDWMSLLLCFLLLPNTSNGLFNYKDKKYKEIKVNKIKHPISNINVLNDLIKQHGEAEVSRLKFGKRYVIEEACYSLHSWFTDYSLNEMEHRVETRVSIKAFRVEPDYRSLICVTEKDERRIKCKHLEVTFKDGFKEVIF